MSRQPGIRWKPWQEPLVVSLRAQGQTYRQIGEVLGVSTTRVGRIWARYLRRERRKCWGCEPEPLEIDMSMSVTMNWLT